MKLCTRHRGDVIAEIKRHNMWHLVSTDITVMLARMSRWLAGVSREYDPLVIILCELLQRATTFLPAEVQKTNKCPCCAADHYIGPGEGHKWIEGFALSAKTTAIVLLGEALTLSGRRGQAPVRNITTPPSGKSIPASGE